MVEQRERTELARELAAEEDVGRGGEIVGECKILIDDLDPDGAGVDGPMEMHRVAVETHVAMARREIAGDDLHQRRLAGAVVAHQADHLAGRDLQVDAMQRADRAEFLADPRQLQNRLPAAAVTMAVSHSFMHVR